MTQSDELKVARCPRCGIQMQICADRNAPWEEKKIINHKVGAWFIHGFGWCCHLCKEEVLSVNENK